MALMAVNQQIMAFPTVGWFPLRGLTVGMLPYLRRGRGWGDQCVILGIANDIPIFPMSYYCTWVLCANRWSSGGWILETWHTMWGWAKKTFRVGRCRWKWPKKRCVLFMCFAVQDCLIYVMLLKGINKWWMWNDYVRSVRFGGRGFLASFLCFRGILSIKDRGAIFVPILSVLTTDTGGLSLTQMAWVESLTVVR